MKFVNYQKAVHYLVHDMPKTAREVFDDDATIKKNFQIMELLGNPQNVHSAVHVAGTSGKGTICYLIDAILRAHSKRTAMTLSPHVYDIRERIQINGQLVSERKFAEILSSILEATSNAGIEISYFEALTAMSYLAFSQSQLNYQIIETGFGGRLDATNVITRNDKICVLGSIGLDHTEALGDTIEKIAYEKAGIVQPGNHVVALRQDPKVNTVFSSRCQDIGATIEWIDQTGDYQKTNDAIAVRVCQILAERAGWVFDETLTESVLRQVFIPGRFEKRHYNNHLVILDGAHNPQKLSALVNRVQKEHKEPATIIFSIGERKDLGQCLQTLKPIAKRIIATEFFTKERDIPKRPFTTRDIVRQCGLLGIEASAESTPAVALNKASEFPEPIIVTGSFYLVGEIDKAF